MLHERRKKFTSDHREQLLEVGLVLESVELARGDDGATVWFVLVTHPRQGLQRYQAALSPN